MVDNNCKIMVTGATGQIGSELVLELRSKYGNDNIIAVGHRTQPEEDLLNSGPFEFADTTNKQALSDIIDKYNIKVIYHLASLLSAVGENKPDLLWDINMIGLKNVLDLARDKHMAQVFWPSSIAAFGPTTPKDNTPNETIMRPNTIYGVSKVAGELLCEYYHHKYGLDVRSLRYPGIISSETLPGGGTTDYAVDIFYQAIEKQKYISFVSESTTLPMMYMPDCIKATIELMLADKNNLKHQCFNVTAMSFSVSELAKEIKKHIPDFVCDYKPDYRQTIADTWPKSIDDGLARQEWGWQPSFDLSKTVKYMLEKIDLKLSKEKEATCQK